MWQRIKCKLAYCLILISNAALAQPGESLYEDALHLLCQVQDDTLNLRWAPSSWALLDLAKEQGFTLEKKTIVGGDTMITQESISVPAPGTFDGSASPMYDAAFEALNHNINGQEWGDGVLGGFTKQEVHATNHGFLLFLADQDFSLALVLGLGFEDTEADLSKINFYKISIAGTEYSASVIGGIGCIEDPVAVEDISAFPDDRQIVLNWDNQTNPSGYVGFYVDRSTDGMSWMRVNELPMAVIVQEELSGKEIMTFRDSVDQNFIDYYYRIQGVNSFGVLGPYSEVVVAQAMPLFEIGTPDIESISNVGDTALLLRWEVDGSDADQVQTYYVKRAPHPDSAFATLDTLRTTTKQYLDTRAGQNNYYIIQARDDLGRYYTGGLTYGQLPDHFPPQAPLGVVATIDSSGRVTISWQPNQERDLGGYRVFYKRYLEDEIIQLTTSSVSDTSYIHVLPLDMLHHRAYYLVRAEDEAGNRSEDSKLVRITVPDTIRPSNPTLVSITSDMPGCTLDMTLSGSGDVDRHILQRRDQGTSDWLDLPFNLHRFTQFRHQVSDTTLQVGQEVEYRLIAMDSSGNISVSNIVQGQRIDSKVRLAPGEPTIIWHRRDKQLIFSWQYPQRDDIQAVRIYRAPVNSNEFFTYLYVYPQDLEMVDTTGRFSKYEYRIPSDKNDEEHSYKIRIDFLDGATSTLERFDNKSRK